MNQDTETTQSFTPAFATNPTDSTPGKVSSKVTLPDPTPPKVNIALLDQNQITDLEFSATLRNGAKYEVHLSPSNIGDKVLSATAMDLGFHPAALARVMSLVSQIMQQIQTEDIFG